MVFQSVSLAMVFMEDQDGSGTLVQTAQMGSPLNDALDISLAFDHLARPMVAAGLEDGELRFYFRDFGVPGFLTLLIVVDAEHPSLASNPETGFPAIAWHDSLDSDLEYAEWDGDLDGDGVVGIIDFLTLLGAWGDCSVCANCPADLNDDCVVNVLDMLILLGNWS